MEPAFYRGDLLFLYHDREVIRSYNLELIKALTITYRFIIMTYR